jgi:hypothetical protein
MTVCGREVICAGIPLPTRNIAKSLVKLLPKVEERVSTVLGAGRVEERRVRLPQLTIVRKQIVGFGRVDRLQRFQIL